MSGSGNSQALEALNAKRKKIASELSDLETKVLYKCNTCAGVECHNSE